jgi:hypothetical protein
LENVSSFCVGHLTGSNLLESYNSELYAGLGLIYSAGEIFLFNSDISYQNAKKALLRRTIAMGAKVALTKSVAVAVAFCKGGTIKGATLGSTAGPAGACVGAGIGLLVGVTTGWYFQYDDALTRDKHDKIFAEVLGIQLLNA